jgi:formylglycine-generating enzyme required for sulfatase activity
MAGNVRTWCRDPYDKNGPPLDLERAVLQPADAEDERSSRVIRGGSWLMRLINSRSSCRFWDIPAARYEFLGLRLARSLHAPKT